VAPADFAQTRSALLATWDHEGPVYYRLGKDDKTSVPGLDGRFAPGRAQNIREGDDLVIVSMGSVTTEAVAAAEALAAHGVSCAISVVASVSPAPVDDLTAILRRHQLALTVEAHYVVGGIGSLVAEVVAEGGLACRVVRCGIKKLEAGISGSQPYLHERYGISSGALVQTALQMLQMREVL
jgi:transketolase